jgi:hypothetical protein
MPKAFPITNEMNKIHTIIILGLIVVLVPYLGVPTSWKTFLNVFLGLFISLLAYLWIKKHGYYSTPPSDISFEEKTGTDQSENESDNYSDVMSK